MPPRLPGRSLAGHAAPAGTGGTLATVALGATLSQLARLIFLVGVRRKRWRRVCPMRITGDFTEE